METLKKLFKGKKILVTGHTGFKGAWLTRMLLQLEAKVVGISLPALENSIWDLTDMNQDIEEYLIDIRDREALDKAIKDIQPEIVFHLAAQALVIEGYHNPIENWASNVMGTAHLMESCRSISALKALVCITTDKVYYNKEWVYPYREDDRLGGHDPYSASKAACELVISSYKDSFYHDKAVGITSVRAGNVIGGGDYADNRIIPDIVRAVSKNKPVVLRSPNSIRPWQHVIDVLWAYILVAKTILEKGQTPSSAYNIAPLDNSNEHTVEFVVNTFIKALGTGSYKIDPSASTVKEMSKLRLDPSLIQEELNWAAIYNTEEAIIQTAKEYKAHMESPESLKAIIDSSVQYYFERRK